MCGRRARPDEGRGTQGRGRRWAVDGDTGCWGVGALVIARRVGVGPAERHGREARLAQSVLPGWAAAWAGRPHRLRLPSRHKAHASGCFGPRRPRLDAPPEKKRGRTTTGFWIDKLYFLLATRGEATAGRPRARLLSTASPRVQSAFVCRPFRADDDRHSPLTHA